MTNGRLINGYAVEAAPNGAWWVHCPDRPHQAWRFATRLEAVRFAQRRRPPPAAVRPLEGGTARRPR